MTSLDHKSIGFWAYPAVLLVALRPGRDSSAWERRFCDVQTWYPPVRIGFPT